MKAGRKRKFRPASEAAFIAAGLHHFIGQDPKTSTHPLLAVLRSVATKLSRHELNKLRDAFDGVNEDGSSIDEEGNL